MYMSSIMIITHIKSVRNLRCLSDIGNTPFRRDEPTAPRFSLPVFYYSKYNKKSQDIPLDFFVFQNFNNPRILSPQG